MTIFATIRDYFGSHVTGIAVENITVNDFILGALTVTAVDEYEHEESGLGYLITVEETFYKGLIVARTATALGRAYYSITSSTPLVVAEWEDYSCAKEGIVFAANWLDYECAKEYEEPVARTITIVNDPSSTGTPPDGNPYISESAPHYDGDTITLNAEDGAAGTFQVFKQYLVDTWVTISGTSPHEVTVSGDMQFRALYTS